MRRWFVFLFLFLPACGELPEVAPYGSADLSGLEERMKPLAIDAAGWWGDSLRHAADSPNRIRMKTLPIKAAALYHEEYERWVITFNSSFAWSDCSLPNEAGYDFLHAAKHEWGHHRGLKHSDDPSSVMWIYVPTCSKGDWLYVDDE